MSSRRQFMLQAALAFAAPVLAQRSGVAHIGFLSPRSSRELAVLNDAFVQGMRDLGYVPGRNLLIEWRFADDRYERLDELARDLVARRVDLIVAAASPAIRAAQKATKTIPIVFPSTGDPVASGLVSSLARPGGNTTGFSSANVDLTSKLLQLLNEVQPHLARLGVLSNPGSATQKSMMASIDKGARMMFLEVVHAAASDEAGINDAFGSLASRGVQGVLIGSDPFLNGHASRIAALAIKYKLPAITQFFGFASAGGLMSYGPDLIENYRRTANLVDRILKGAKPAEMPVEEASKLKLWVNLTAARALGLPIPSSILARADEVLEAGASG